MRENICADMLESNITLLAANFFLASGKSAARGPG